MPDHRVWLISSFACVFAALVIAESAFAEGEAEEDVWSGVDEMVVVGNPGGVLGILNETGSVTSFDSEDLEAYGIENTADLAEFTPNLDIPALQGF